MVSAFDVAAYILGKLGELSAVKLQKLLYYSQAWSLVWNDKPLFGERIEAWANGPVVRSFYAWHRRQFSIAPFHIQEYARLGGQADPNRLSPEQRATVDRVIEFYGPKDSQWLSDLTHMEQPWRLAREGVPDGERCENEISQVSMAEYYTSIYAKS